MQKYSKKYTPMNTVYPEFGVICHLLNTAKIRIILRLIGKCNYFRVLASSSRRWWWSYLWHFSDRRASNLSKHIIQLLPHRRSTQADMLLTFHWLFNSYDSAIIYLTCHGNHYLAQLCIATMTCHYIELNILYHQHMGAVFDICI